MWNRFVFMLGCGGLIGGGPAAPLPLEKGKPIMESISGGRWHFDGELGARIDGNVTHWLLRAPGANPGILEMFRRRNRYRPYAEPVPWAGEFAGKYLISAVQACRMSDDPRLKPFVQAFVDQLVACQADNGYLGPWPTKQELLGHWDLWGHYHCMLGLLMWADDTGDRSALEAVERAAECICRVYVDSGRRPIEAGSPPMNLAVLHIFAELYRRTGNPRYWELIRRIEEDLPQDGDWLRQGAAGVPYYQLPGSGPRWESLHIVQGFAPLFVATGEERYRQALLSLWNSIRQYDRHPSGAFSSNEGATGSIYAGGSIETCCSVAWMALTLDALRLTGDPTMADELELTLWNQALAAQHPSGNWCTYDTPINGVRAPSYQQIHFQYRPGTPELNCCSVNGPRTLGMLSEWAVMRDAEGLAVNFYGPSTMDLPLRDGIRLRLVQKTRYPVEGQVRLELDLERASTFTLRLRIPAWSQRTSVRVHGEPLPASPAPGTYLALRREWRKGDAVELELDLRPRYVAGQGPQWGGRVALYVGPLLLAFDAYRNALETVDLKPINVAELQLEPVPVTEPRSPVHFPPLGLWRTATEGGAPVVLCDFASAGAHGTDYAAWLPASHLPPPATTLKMPAPEAIGAPGPVLFRWTPSGAPEETYELLIARDAAFQQVVVHLKNLRETHATVAEGLAEDGVYYWKVQTVNAYGVTENREGPRPFRVDHTAREPFFTWREDGLLVASPLDGGGAPSWGSLTLEEGLAPAPDRHGHPNGAVRFSGSSRLRYALPFFPERDYSFCAWVCPEGLPVQGIQQIFSAWCRGMDDPLRVTLDGSAVFARIEAGGAWGTAGVTLENGVWVHVAAVKEGTSLTLYVNGQAAQATAVPEYVRSQSTDIGIGFNPLYPGGEHFLGKMDDFAFYGRALTATEVEKAFLK